ncbi:MAG: cupin fold metalloprotein, WbuC family [Lysobacterales bacterium]|nr:MAG: cupin fold metalloprotein, WbuC family [Xanthomonadales bacterium]
MNRTLRKRIAMQIFTGQLLDELAAKASASPRGRTNFNIHASAADPVQRFFVVANRQSYFRPHRHLSKSELALVLRGQFEVITFDDRGAVTARHVVGGDAGGFAFEIPHATWHTLIAREDGSTFLEIKEGPYDRAAAAEFASWAPAEGESSVPQFMRWLRTAQPGEPHP